MKRAEIQSAGRKWLGVRWQHQGRSRFGLDCGGIPIMIFRDLNYPHTDLEGYSRQPDGHTIDEHMSKLLDTKAVKDMKPGDLVLLGEDINFPCHLALVTELPANDAARPGAMDLALLHSHAAMSARKVVEHPMDDFWRSRIRKCWAFRGIED